MARKKKSALREDLKKKKALRKRTMITCVIGVAVALCAVGARQALAGSGAMPYGESLADIAVYILTLGGCFVIAPRFMGYLRLGREIKDLEAQIAE